jgi:Fe-S-cluster containining protein
VTPPLSPRVRALSIHADYRCRHAGACCSSGWEIPVDPPAERRIRRGVASGRLRVLRAATPADGALTPSAWSRPAAGPAGGLALRQDALGACVFLDPETRLCAVHRQVGEQALPSACRHFPRVATLTPLGVSVTLSHFCPSAAGMLFRLPSRPVAPDATGAPRDDGVAVVEDPPAFPASWPWEGLDARSALPPLLRPGVLMDWPSLERWEGFAVSVLAEEGLPPDEGLDVLEAAAERARAWAPAEGPFAGFLERSLAPSFRGAPTRTQLLGMARPSPANPWRLVAEAVPHRERLPPAPPGSTADARWVAPAWPSLARPVRRWLAAKAFASWLVLQGEGLRTAVLGLRVALGVLRAEAARGGAEAGRALDEELLKEAIRRADLLLVHLADPEALARRLSRVEARHGSTGPPEPGRP